jgi:hypothetical protein
MPGRIGWGGSDYCQGKRRIRDFKIEMFDPRKKHVYFFYQPLIQESLGKRKICQTEDFLKNFLYRENLEVHKRFGSPEMNILFEGL